MFLEISQNSQENTCVRVSFLKNTFFTQHFWATASNGGFRETNKEKQSCNLILEILINYEYMNKLINCEC